MLALIAGMGDLPMALVARLPERPLVCALDGFEPILQTDITFRLEHLGTFLQTLQARGVTQICMAGAVRRPQIDPAAIDAATMPLIPKVQAAMAKGDDGALRVIISLLEEAGFAVVAAHEIAPDLLPEAGVLTQAVPGSDHKTSAMLGDDCIAAMGAADVGQACIMSAGQVLAKEGPDGTDAMLSSLSGAHDAILFKAPKPQQDLRADLPLIGPDTAKRAVEAGLAGIVIEAGGVMVLDLAEVLAALDAHGLFLWVRPKGDA
ncbi:UDP-2,3-diacylglucosamine diphosphatase LpxI domain-containing protein [Yoonia sp. BS5-3]|uniref:LpxI family protein n=1 Tax=Yoonia phaeophyticola TaxID=3137369 RepID=A0ABZ2V528_9RHOB